MIISVYRPKHWSWNVKNKLFAFQIIIVTFPVVMLVITKAPFRIGIGLLGFGVAIKPKEGGRKWKIERT